MDDELEQWDIICPIDPQRRFGLMVVYINPGLVAHVNIGWADDAPRCLNCILISGPLRADKDMPPEVLATLSRIRFIPTSCVRFATRPAEVFHPDNFNLAAYVGYDRGMMQRYGLLPDLMEK